MKVRSCSMDAYINQNHKNKHIVFLAYHTHTIRRACNEHTHARTHAHTHVGRGDRHGYEKDSLEIVLEQVRLEGGFKTKRRIKAAECLRQTVPNRWASVRKGSHQMFLDLHQVRQRFVCRMRIVIVLLEYKVEGDRTDTEGLFMKWN